MQVEEVLHHFRSPNKKKHCLQSIEAFLREKESNTYVVYYGFARYFCKYNRRSKKDSY